MSITIKPVKSIEQINSKFPPQPVFRSNPKEEEAWSRLYQAKYNKSIAKHGKRAFKLIKVSSSENLLKAFKKYSPNEYLPSYAEDDFKTYFFKKYLSKWERFGGDHMTAIRFVTINFDSYLNQM